MLIKQGVPTKVPLRLFDMFDYITPITGITPTQAIEDITLVNGDPVLITISDHGLNNFNLVYISNVIGTSELNGNTYQTYLDSSDTFGLLDTLSSCFSAYSSGGIITNLFTKISKAGATPVEPDDGTFAELDTASLLGRGNDGTYTVSLSSADTDTEGILTVHVDCGRAMPAVLEIYVESDPVGAGTGSITVSYLVTEPPEETGTPIPGVSVQVTTDVLGLNLVATGTTDSFGIATFYLNPGTYYLWRQKYGYDFVNPDTEVISS